MAIPSFFTFFLLLLLHLGCFFTTSPKHSQSSSKLSKHPHTSQKLPKRSHPLKRKATKALSSTWSFLTHFLHKPAPSPQPDLPKPHKPVPKPGPEFSSDPLSHPLLNNIYPCPTCGEVFQIPNLLEHHKTTKHAVTTLLDGESGRNIVQIIFNSGWPSKAQPVTIQRVLKIHNGPKILALFEHHREAVQTRAIKDSNGRCIADGNELLRFYCATFTCSLGQNGSSGICRGEFCSLCGIIRSGFSSKMDGVATWPTSYRAHLAVPEEMEKEFGFMNVRRAVLVCRVIAGRVGCESEFGGEEEGNGFDSVLGGKINGDDELVVFNPRAVLPCFVIVYTV